MATAVASYSTRKWFQYQHEDWFILDVFILSRLTIVFSPQILYDINPWNAELKPICHFLALLGAHPILHVSRIRVNLTYANGRHHNCNALSLFCQLQYGEDICVWTCVGIQIQSNNDSIHKNISHYIILERENYLVVQFSLNFGAVFIYLFTKKANRQLFKKNCMLLNLSIGELN
jgi:hypothetical protein